MESPGQTFDRLLTALDDLVTQEAAALRSGDYTAVGELQRRADPVVTALAGLGAETAGTAARARVAALLARRQHSIDFIEPQLATARAELMAVQESTQRVARIAPVYGRAEGVVRTTQWQAAG